MTEKRAYEKPAVPTKDFESFGYLPFKPKAKKKLECPRCGVRGEITGKRNVDGNDIYRCKGCKIEYSENLKKAYCSFDVNRKNGHWVTVKATKEKIFVKAIVPSECRKCSLYKTFFAIKIKCPNFRGLIGKELTPPEGWDKA
jgi:hypothetical protein